MYGRVEGWLFDADSVKTGAAIEWGRAESPHTVIKTLRSGIRLKTWSTENSHLLHCEAKQAQNMTMCLSPKVQAPKLGVDRHVCVHLPQSLLGIGKAVTKVSKPRRPS